MLVTRSHQIAPTRMKCLMTSFNESSKLKHIAINYEQQFTKLGYSAALMLDSILYLHMLLTESHLSDHHIEIVCMFLESELLMAELAVFAYLSYKITLSFFNFIEVRSQFSSLLQIFPQHFNGLEEDRMDTLKDYNSQKPTTDIA